MKFVRCVAGGIRTLFFFQNVQMGRILIFLHIFPEAASIFHKDISSICLSGFTQTTT